MSVAREEDRQKNGCPSRGLGVAAAAIGVGVGAALYYFFNKRAEHPNTEGSTSDWNCQRPQPLWVYQYGLKSLVSLSLGLFPNIMTVHDFKDFEFVIL